MPFVTLEQVDGPVCPRCGCRDSLVLQEPAERNGKPVEWFASGRARCRHCGVMFAFRAKPPIHHEEPIDAKRPEPPRDTAYPVRGCPECGSPETYVASSGKQKPGRPRVRYHKCRDCGANFKSTDSRKLSV